MIFSSVEFLLFLTFVLAIFWGTLGRLREPASFRPQHLFLLLASYYFYMSWNAVLILLIVFSTLVDYVLGARIHASTCLRRRRTLLILSLVINLGLLALFKYANFFIDNTNAVLGMFSMRVPFVVDIILPVGISFFTFQSMSYTIDIYRRELQPARSFTDFALFVSFFPQLVAGPIVRASQFLPQLDRPRRPGDIDIDRGLNYLLLGLVKKVLISDWLSTIADPLFANPLEYNGLGVWMGVIAYTLQIYCDFSGYSDMAIGTAALLGYRLPDNFNMPYLSRNISEFWSRWHISLSTWLRDYLYIPLGGNRFGHLLTLRNLLVVMFLGGLWHGAQWTFVAWGCAHGLALVVHKEFRRRFPLDQSRRLSPAGIALGWLGTMIFVCATWVLFRAPSFETARILLTKMAFLDNSGSSPASPVLALCLVIVVLSHLAGVRMFGGGGAGFPHVRLPFRAFGYAVVALVLLLLAPSGARPFIYFQF